MPLTPSNGDRHAQPLIRLYKALELALWRWIAKALGLNGFGRRWLMRILMNLPRFRTGVRKLVDDAGDRAPALVREAIDRGWADGAAAARTDIGSDRPHTDDWITNRLIDRVLDALTAANRGLPGATEAILQRAAGPAASAESAQQHREALDRSLQRDARQGFTALVDTNGRRRELVAYVEAQIRGAVSAAEIEGYTQQLVAEGHDLFVVSDVPGSCETCRPFEGRIISITGSTAGAISRNTGTNTAVAVNVMCSLREAIDRGLFHPNCRHTIRVWTPDNAAPPRAVRVSERQRTVRRAAAANARRARAQARMSHAAMFGPQRRKASGEGGEGKPPNQPSIPPSAYDDAATPTEVAQRLGSRFGIDVIGFDSPGVDLEVAREYARAVDDMLTRFPYVDLRAVRIGPDRLGDNSYARTWPAQRPDGSFIVNPDGSITTDEINLHIDYATNPARLAEEAARDVARGFHCINSDLRPVYTTIVHEFGHALDNQGGMAAQWDAGPEMFDYWNDRYSDPNDDIMVRGQKQAVWMQQLSGYSFLPHRPPDPPKQHVNWVEALAEAFEDVETNGDDASEAAKAICAILINLSRGGQPQ